MRVVKTPTAGEPQENRRKIIPLFVKFYINHVGFILDFFVNLLFYS